MKAIKITVIALFAIGFLTGVSQLEETKTTESLNKEMNSPKVKMITFLEITKKKDPGMG